MSTEIPLSAEVLAEEGRCCGRECLNCPYVPRHQAKAYHIDRNWLVFSRLMPHAAYTDYYRTLYGADRRQRRYLVVGVVDAAGHLRESLVSAKPPLGGYRSEKKYGDPYYCPAATRQHRKNLTLGLALSNLIYFDGVKSAVAAGFSPCGVCQLRGERALYNWKEYVRHCRELEISPAAPTKNIQKLLG